MPEGGTKTSFAPIAAQARVTASFQTPWSIFSPGVPLVPPDPQPTRNFDFFVGQNTIISPRTYEAFSFAQLRAFANVELVRLAIETRKDQFDTLNWQVKPRDGKKAKDGTKAQIEAAESFWRRPDGVRPFRRWLRRSLEDLFVLDAPVWERVRTREGKFVALKYVPGDTIKLLVDESGETPEAPTPAYQQIIKGRVWNNLTTDDLIYAPRNERGNHLYGFGNVEQIVVSINIALRRQAAQLGYFTEGNVPQGILNAPANWTPDHIKDMQAWFDSRLAGNQAERSKLIWTPAETKYQAFKDAPLKDEFDEWLARVVCFAFSLPPTAFIKQMNRSTSENDKERAEEEGLEPLKLWWKQIADDVIANDLGFPDLEWAWREDIAIDPAVQSEIDDRDLKNGSATLDEVRDRRGGDPYPKGIGAKPMIYLATGPVLVEEAIKPPEDPQAVDPNAPPPKGGQRPPTGGKQPPAVPDDAGKLAKGAPTLAMSRPKARRILAAAKRATAKALTAAGDDVAAQVGAAFKRLGKVAPPADDSSGEFTGKPVAADVVMHGLDWSGLSAVADALRPELEAMASDSGAVVLAQIGVGDEADLVNQIDARAIAYAKNRAAELVSLQGPRNIVDATRQEIRDVIAAGLEENLSADDIAAGVQEATAFSSSRAELIAKTEIADANSVAALDGARAAKATGLVVLKTWELGEEPCDECQDNADAGAIALEDSFPSGDDAPTAHPNCQCAVSFETAEADSED